MVSTVRITEIQYVVKMQSFVTLNLMVNIIISVL
jgi:hypothetical protein